MYLHHNTVGYGTDLRHTAATISYAGQLLLGPTPGSYDALAPVPLNTDLQSMYDLQLEHKYKTTAYRRATHKISEQKRRKILNSRFDDLRNIIPSCREGAHSKHSVLKKAMIYIEQLTRELMLQDHVIREMHPEREKMKFFQQEHAEWSNRITALRQGLRVRHQQSELPSNDHVITAPRLPPGPASSSHLSTINISININRQRQQQQQPLQQDFHIN